MSVRSEFETYLNNLYEDTISDVTTALEKFDYLTAPNRKNRTTKSVIIGHYQNEQLGSLLKKYDPIAFNTMLNEQSGNYERGGDLEDEGKFMDISPRTYYFNQKYSNKTQEELKEEIINLGRRFEI